MTRSDVFKPPFDWILDTLKMMPIYRIRDGYSTLQKNEDVFDTCRKLLESKQGLLIFPEGNHGLDYYLRPLTKGMARIALQAQEKISSSITVIPVGLNYFDHFNSGNKLVIKYGIPISVNDYMSRYKEHPQKGLRGITKDVSQGMKTTLIIPDNDEDYHIQKRIFSRRNEALSFDQLHSLKHKSSYTQVEKNYTILGYLGELISILNWPPLFLARWVLKNKVSQKIFTSSIKVAIGIFIFPLWYLFSFLIVGLVFNWTWGFLIVIIQLSTIVIRQELVRLSR